MKNIGFSTKAVVAPGLSLISEPVIKHCRDFSDTIECCIQDYGYIPFVSTWLFKIFFINQNFKNISISLPTDIVYRPLSYPRPGKKQLGVKAKLALLEIADFKNGLTTSYCLVDPRKVSNWDVFYDFPGTVATKNTETTLNTASEVYSFFQKHPNIFFVWDIGKWPQNEILDKEFMKWNLVGIHLSTKNQSPIYQASNREIDLLVKGIHKYANLSIPIILTGRCIDKKEMEREFRFVIKNI